MVIEQIERHGSLLTLNNNMPVKQHINIVFLSRTTTPPQVLSTVTPKQKKKAGQNDVDSAQPIKQMRYTHCVQPKAVGKQKSAALSVIASSAQNTYFAFAQSVQTNSDFGLV
ncbi:hypothetical protein RRG08_017945 [Elysia crispata]|uniref:Uncharacterized protein n=1 Tax=Elysia crispata TaxID=231223 RepID=A0AAE1DEM1_9GAST|nr:hypothetical protein RRG08_017945 [Elysia crispata]